MRIPLASLVVLGMAAAGYGDPQDCTVDFTLKVRPGGSPPSEVPSGPGIDTWIYDPDVPGSENFILDIWVQWDYGGGATVMMGADSTLRASACGSRILNGSIASNGSLNDRVVAKYT